LCRKQALKLFLLASTCTWRPIGPGEPNHGHTEQRQYQPRWGKRARPRLFQQQVTSNATSGHCPIEDGDQHRLRYIGPVTGGIGNGRL
jgi:hypothetical protein